MMTNPLCAQHGQVEGLNVVFIEPDNGMFRVGCIYGGQNNAKRFGFFCGAALEYMKIFKTRPDVIHCHNCHTAPVAWGDRHNARCVFTVHNLNYGADLIGKAMAHCNVGTTVSRTYATEVLWGITFFLFFSCMGVSLWGARALDGSFVFHNFGCS